MSPTYPYKQDSLKQGLTCRPFEHLAEKLAGFSKSPQGETLHPKKGKSTPCACKQESDTELFLKAMKDVTPLKDRKVITQPHFKKSKTKTQPSPLDQDLQEAIQELKDLVQGKRPLPVEHIPEYMDGPRINSDRRLLRRLRSGGFAIQAYCELHGLTAYEALKVCDGFLADSLMSNRRCIAYIHGRGRSSPGKPVLKEMVKNFLNRGRFRRYIMAYCSAPSWDGGPGVTYVLLRKRPVKKAKRR